jgi:hypothetical protein
VAATTGLALLVGALIDGIPESAAIGLSTAVWKFVRG